MVWMFQEGHLASIFGFIASPINLAMLVLSASMAFGLSMELEGCLPGRTKMARDHGAAFAYDVVTGVSETGRIIIQMLCLATGLAIPSTRRLYESSWCQP